ncbi:hypothetical protein ANCDUO_27311, partial [Ancylostoma duodenale]
SSEGTRKADVYCKTTDQPPCKEYKKAQDGKKNPQRCCHHFMFRCALEWEYLANVIDRVLLTLFSFVTMTFFLMLVFFDQLFTVHTLPHKNS